MKKFAKTLISMGIVGALALNTPLAFAAETDAGEEDTAVGQIQQEAGLTPENTFYFLDKFGERFHLLFTRNAEKKSNLYLQFAKERLAESNKLTDTSKDKYVAALMDAYMENMDNAQENIKNVLISNKNDDGVKEELAANLEKTATFVTDESVEAALDEKKLLQLQDKKQEGYLVANMMKDLDVKQVKEMQAQGLHFGEIVKVIAFSQESGRSEKEIVGMFKGHDKNFGLVAKDLNVQQVDIWNKVQDRKLNAVQKAYEKAIVSGNESEITRIGKKIDAISNEQVVIGIERQDGNRVNGMEKKLSIIQEKAAAGYITQEKADMITQKMQKNYDKQKDYGYDQKAVEDKIAKNKTYDQEKQAAKQQKEQNKSQDKDVKSEQKSQDKASEQKKKDIEKEADNNRKAKEKAAEQAQKDQEKAAEQAKKDAEKVADNDRKEKEKAAEQARKDQEKAAENDRKAKEKAAEQAQKDQEKAAEQAKKAAENDRKAKEKAAEQAQKDQEKAAEQARKDAEKAAKEKEKQAKNNQD